MAKAAQLQHLLEQQDELFEVISSSVAKLKITPTITYQRVQSRISALTENWNNFKQNHTTLGSIKASLKTEARTECEEEPYFQKKLYSECEEKYLDALEEMSILLEEIQSRNTVTGTSLAETSANRQLPSFTSNIRLPQLDLLSFSGDYAEWVPFKDTFTSVIGTHPSLTCIEKLQYLKGCLTGKAAQRLMNLPLTAANFKIAWDDLVDYYDNKRILIDTSLENLFASKPVTRESASDLETLLNNVNQSLGALEGLGVKVEQWNEVLVYVVSRKLDASSVKEWEKKLGSSKESAAWKELKDFIQTRIRSLQAFERSIPQRQDHRRPTTSSSTKCLTNKLKSHHVSVKNPINSCSYCKENHYISACPNYQQKSTEQRYQLIKQLKLCFNCLGNHQVSSCFSRKRCNICSGHHHTSIHPNTENNTSQQSSTNPQTTSSVKTASTNVANIYPLNCGTLLTTALVKIPSITGEVHVVRAFLDQGSEVNLISENLCQLLQVKRSHTSLSIVGIGAELSSTNQSKGRVTLKLLSCVNNFTCSFDAYVLKKLTNYLPSTKIAIQNWPHLQDLELADPEYYQPGRIDLILGVKIYSQIIQSGVRKGSIEAPIAQQTNLGWIISGATLPTRSSLSEEAQSFHCHIDHDLNDLVKQFWLQEEVFQTATEAVTPEEAYCEEFFKTTHYRNSDGRYVVRLPFKFYPPRFGDTRSQVLKLLHRLQKRFLLNPSFHADYTKFIKEYEDMGHMCRAHEPPQSNEQAFYLPHHGVIRESSSTTKLRVVFNGSHKTQEGTSLNDCLHEGPKLHVDLPDVLTRWRKNQYVFSSDVVKMFRQILIHPDDWNFQRILWLEDFRLVEFCLTTVTYGTSPAPYLANKVLRQLAEDEGYQFPDAKEIIEQSTYVDDIYGGAESIVKGRQIIKQIIDLFKAGGFPLQKWASNDERLLDDIAQDQRAAYSSSLSITDGPIHRTLGLNWQPQQDRFIFIADKTTQPTTYTKREVLSRIARLYDPLGWLSPVIVRGKIFMQELWEAGIGWDEPIPITFESRFITYMNQLQDLSLISVPRWLGLSPSTQSVEIHGFADASQAALGAVVYLRVVSERKDIRVTIISSKSKVAPIGKIKSTKRPRSIRVTIPRLELSAALLLARHVAYVQKVLSIDTSATHLWTDSSTTLFWIQGHPNRWKDFVRNRVSQIQTTVPAAQWHHLPGESNPADFASRGLSPKQLSENSLWWHGPPWLQLHSNHWPQLIPQLDEDVDTEVRHPTVAATLKQTDHTWDLLRRYSSLTKLLRITAWCRRIITFYRNLKSNLQSSHEILLNPDELEQAKFFWIKCVQHQSFSSEINQLCLLKPICRSSPLFRLTPFVDAKGILRIGGRLRNAQIDPDMKHPVILPRDSYFTYLILDHTHKTTLHGGVQLMLATIRRNYWIIGGRNPIRAFVHRCVICTRHRASTSKQLMGQLPINRTLPSRPFLHSGVDYAGPFSLKTWRGRGAKVYKGYLVLFVCFASSAVHLELSTDYTTAGFLAAYRRFTGRRGICSTLTSDCGTNFIGADAELRKLFNSASNNIRHLIDLLANDGTKWMFNPPASPHFGGKWEAAVKSTKFHIKRVIGDALLTYEEFSTFLVQVEAVLNSRPICPLSDDHSDLEALTPGHFITGEALNAVPEPSIIHLPASKLTRYQLLRQMVEKFWQRWTAEYL